MNKKKGRLSTKKKKLKNGYYMSISNSISSKPVRIMRDTFEEMKLVEEKFRNRDFKYLGQVRDNKWLDGENKGKTTN
jgi:hypothetical protein